MVEMVKMPRYAVCYLLWVKIQELCRKRPVIYFTNWFERYFRVFICKLILFERLLLRWLLLSSWGNFCELFRINFVQRCFIIAFAFRWTWEPGVPGSQGPPEPPGKPPGGVVYTRWGRKHCPSKTIEMYSGNKIFHFISAIKHWSYSALYSSLEWQPYNWVSNLQYRCDGRIILHCRWRRLKLSLSTIESDFREILQWDSSVNFYARCGVSYHWWTE